MRPRVRVLCLPDVDRAIGGVKQLYRHVEHLLALGWDAPWSPKRLVFVPRGSVRTLQLGHWLRSPAW